jgi:hypothetical protein
MQRSVVTKPVQERDHDPLQEGLSRLDHPPGLGSFFLSQEPRAASDRDALRMAQERRGRGIDVVVPAEALRLPGPVVSSEVRPAAIDGDRHGGPDGRTVTSERREERGSVISQSLQIAIHHGTRVRSGTSSL